MSAGGVSVGGGVIGKVGWIHVEGRRLLAVRTGGRGLFYIPGGKREPGEDDAAALLREIAEELGVALDPATLAPAGLFRAAADGAPDKTVEVTAYTATFTGTLAPGNEIAEHRFLASADAPLASGALRQILDQLKAADAID